MDRALRSREVVDRALDRPRLIVEEGVRDLRRGGRQPVAREVRHGHRRAESLPEADAAASVDDQAGADGVAHVRRAGLDVALERDPVAEVVGGRLLADVERDCDPIAAHLGPGSGRLHRARSGEEEEQTTNDGSHRVHGSAQLTPTAVHACETARSAALLLP